MAPRIDPRDLALHAVGAAGAVATNVAQALRDDDDLPALLFREDVVSDAADALNSLLSIAVDAPDTGALGDRDRREALGQLMGAVSKFLVDWS